MGGAYYNEFDPGAAAWLRELMRAGLIADGEVDERSILDVSADDVRGFTQCHWFAGIGGWSYALRLAGWPDDRPVWTGSPPCQPFSVAGKQKGRDDARHLAPKFINLVGSASPGMLFGEQVASSDVFGKAAKRARGNFVAPPQWAWLDDLSDRLEAARYAVGAIDFPSAGVGAPHIRQRTFFGAVSHEWMADALHPERWTVSQHREDGRDRQNSRREEAHGVFGTCGEVRGMADCDGAGLERHRGHGDGSHEPGRLDPHTTGSLAAAGADGGMADAEGSRRTDGSEINESCASVHGASAEVERVGHRVPSGDSRSACPLHGFWRDSDWLFCRDGKWRPVEPGLKPLAHGVSGRVGLLRGYGNAINPHAAAEFIQAFNAVIEGREWMVEPTAITPPFPQQMSLFS